MTDETKCPPWGKPVTHTGLGGICPECMLQAGAPTSAMNVVQDQLILKEQGSS